MSDPRRIPPTLQSGNAAGSIGRRLCRLALCGFRVHRFPRYFADLSATHLLPRWLKGCGLSVSSGTRFIGFPIIALAPDSVIEIGQSCFFISRSESTALGVNHPVVLRTVQPGAKLRIGAGVRMSGTSVCAAVQVAIGDRCVVGANVTIVDTDFHSLDPVVRCSPQDASGARATPVEIGDDVFIGGGTFILKGTHIGNGAVIGAASVVTGTVPPGAIYAGNPARQAGMVAFKG